MPPGVALIVGWRAAPARLPSPCKRADSEQSLRLFELTRRRQELRPVESASVRHVVYLAAIDRASDGLIADTATHTCSALAEHPIGAARRGGSVLHSSGLNAGRDTSKASPTRIAMQEARLMAGQSVRVIASGSQ